MFFIYLYQRWIYRVDPRRVNEFGTSGDSVATRPQQEPLQAAASSGQSREEETGTASGSDGETELTGVEGESGKGGTVPRAGEDKEGGGAVRRRNRATNRS